MTTDQGSKAANSPRESVQAVKDRGCNLSMDGRGAWRDNVFVERLWKSVKYERVYLHACDSVTEARASIMQYLDRYNRSGPHSGLGRKTPDEAYAAMLPRVKLAA
jgi:putative transposase